MSKPLSSFPEEVRTKIAERRVLANTGGLGYWAAVDYLAWHKKNSQKKLEKVLKAAKGK